MNGWCCTDYASMTTLFSSRFRKFPAVPIAVYVLFIGVQANAQAQAPLGWQAAKEPTSSVARIISRKDAVAVAGSLELAEADSGERNPKDALIQLGWARLIFPTPSPAVSKIDSITHTATVSDQMPSSDKGVTKVANLIEFSAENEVESISEYPQSQPEMQVSFNSSSQFTVIDSDASNVPEQLPFEPEQLPFEEGEITQTPENVPVTEGEQVASDSFIARPPMEAHESYTSATFSAGPLANQLGENGNLLAPFYARQRPSEQPHVDQSLPSGYLPWWAERVAKSAGIKPSPSHYTLDQLIHSALENSPHIQVAAAAPNIRQAQLLEESSQFDWTRFLSSIYDDTNDPIGNTLTTGNADDRFTQQDWTSRGGVRRRNRKGGELEISQQFGYLDNNSSFLIPGDQGNSRLVLNYRHPLMRGRGRAVNESLIVLANLDFQAAGDDLLTEIQTHLVQLTETYWELVRARSALLQRQRLLAKAETVLSQLKGRAEVDALDRQVFRAKAAVAARRAEIARAVTSIRNAESRLRLLVNDEEIVNAARTEFIPLDIPSSELLPIKLEDAISTALANRPDISRAIRAVKSTSVRLGVAKNDLLPKLDLLVGSYVAGLEGSSDVPQAFVNQFRDGRPGFNVGFDFEIPIGNRAARAREQQRKWELERSTQQFRVVVETGLMEVELAVREVDTAYQEMQGRYLAMVAASNESEYLTDRWQTLPGINDSVTQLIENLLDSQERLADEEAAYANAQFDYSVAAVRLKQAMGTLFILHN